MLTHFQALDALKRLHPVAKTLADKIKTIADGMEGKGVSPADSPLKIAKLKEIEQELRMLGSDQDNPVPFLFK